MRWQGLFRPGFSLQHEDVVAKTLKDYADIKIARMEVSQNFVPAIFGRKQFSKETEYFWTLGRLALLEISLLGQPQRLQVPSESIRGAQSQDVVAPYRPRCILCSYLEAFGNTSPTVDDGAHVAVLSCKAPRLHFCTSDPRQHHCFQRTVFRTLNFNNGTGGSQDSSALVSRATVGRPEVWVLQWLAKLHGTANFKHKLGSGRETSMGRYGSRQKTTLFPTVAKLQLDYCRGLRP